MTDYASLNGARVTTWDVQVPAYGLWVADVAVALNEDESVATGAQSFVLGNLTLAGATLRGQSFAGEYKARLVGGFGGWLKTLPAQGYQNPAGLMASMILKDAATVAGEQVNVADDYVVGQFWMREAAPGARTLRLLAPPDSSTLPIWWVDPTTGITQVHLARPSVAIASDFEAIDYDPGRGLMHITTEDPASWMPGNTFASPFLPTTSTISSTRIVSGNDGEMRLMVLVQ